MKTTPPKIAISVRDFAVPVPRLGSIEGLSGYGDQSAEGRDAHTRLQSERAAVNPAYRREVTVNGVFEHAGHVIEIAGRMDGLFPADDDTPPLIEEIKATFAANELADRVARDRWHPYVLQLLTYAHLWRLREGVLPERRLVIVNFRTGDQTDVDIPWDDAEFAAWWDRRLDELVREFQERADLETRRRGAADAIAFPFAFPRRGQRELIASIESSLRPRESSDDVGQSQIMIQAPTGLGKTVGVLYPTLKDALARGRQTLYVTPKNSQHLVALDAMQRLQSRGADIKSLTLTAKGKICLKPEPLCNPDYCEFARDYYAKVDSNNLLRRLAEHANLTSDVFLDYARLFEVCPFELSLDASARTDVIICDYNYVFAPNVALKRLEAGNADHTVNPNLVVDEAHNLPTRAMDYFSPALSAGYLRSMNERINQLKPRFAAEARRHLNTALDVIHALNPDRPGPMLRVAISEDPFFDVEATLADFQSRYLRSMPEIKPGDVVLELNRYWSGFCNALPLADDRFFATYQRHPNGDIVKITCCDASPHLADKMGAFANVVAFSATLKPFTYYAELGGFDVETLKTLEFASPFPRENRKILVIPQISTKYDDREKNYPKVGEVITRLADLHPGNYFAFFPSFEFLDRTLPFITPRARRVLRQSPGQPVTETKAILDRLKDATKDILMLAVQGGVFAEGIDYPGDELIGAFIVGPALPSHNLERQLLRDYYDKRYGQGFDYAYTYPAMAKVIQAAGRVIRSEHDRGLIVLMDRRFGLPTYTKAMPADWFITSVDELISKSILSDVAAFWTPDTDGSPP